MYDSYINDVVSHCLQVDTKNICFSQYKTHEEKGYVIIMYALKSFKFYYKFSLKIIEWEILETLKYFKYFYIHEEF